MTLPQHCLNAAAFARSAATATNPRMSELQARRVLNDIKRAQAELTAAKGIAVEEIRQAKDRDKAEAQDRAITARCWANYGMEIPA